MVPSLTAVDADGVPRTPGLLYGDGRGRSSASGANPVESRELLEFLRWTRAEDPGRCRVLARDRGRQPRAVRRRGARHRRPRPPRSRSSTGRAGTRRSRRRSEITVDQLPRLVPTAWECGRIGGADGPVLASGCIDALADQIVAGADNEGDVLVLLGTTLIVNTVTASHDPVPGYWVIPHTSRGKFLAGGPSNAGGLFVNWATAPLADVCRRAARSAPRPGLGAVPARRAGADARSRPSRGARRSRSHARCGCAATRGIRGVRASSPVASSTRRARRTAPTRNGSSRPVAGRGWTSGCRRWPIAPGCRSSARRSRKAPRSGSAFLARCAAGLEDGGMLDAARWARPGRTVEPAPAWVEPAAQRYRRFLDLSA